MRPLLSSSLRHLARTNIALALNPALRTSVRLPRLPSFPIQRNFTSSAFRSRNPQYLRFNVDPEKPFDWKRWDTATKVTAGVVVLGVGYYLVHLERVPETGRWRFMDASSTFETRMAKESHAQLVQEFGSKILPQNHPQTRYVRRIVTQLLEASNLGTLKSDPSSVAPGRVVPQDMWTPDSGRTEDVVPGSGGREWQLMVVKDDKMVNAMASFGNIVVFTGILPIAKDEDGLAAVIGHEIGHVVARHNAERYSSVKVLLAVATVLQAAFSIDFGISQFLTTLLLELPNSRTQELEADSIGLKIAARACFDPQGAPAMFTRLGQAEKQGGMNLGFLNTHPTSDKRVQMLQGILSEAYSIKAASPICAGTQDNFDAFRYSGAFGAMEMGGETTSSQLRWSGE